MYLPTFKIIILSWLLSGSTKGTAQNSNIYNDKETLERLEYQWLLAEFRLDTATIASMMDKKFIAVGITGLSGKQEELVGIYRNMEQRKENEHIVDSLYLEDFNVQQHGNTAIVTFFSITKGRIQGRPFQNRKTRMYDVWIKNKGQWKAISSQVTPVL